MKSPDAKAPTGKRETGIVSRVYGAYYNILPLPDLAPEIRGRLRGRLRLEKISEENIKMRHLIMVGDHVTYRIEKEGTGESPSEATIESLLPRKNALMRSSPFETQGLGANLDRALLVASLVRPIPRFGFIDRFLASCHAGGVEPLLLFTKTDLLLALEDAEKRESILSMVETYSDLGYDIYLGNLLSDPPDEDLLRLRSVLDEGITLFAGNSGTGKSTLINLLLGREAQSIGEVSESTGKGKHTTTNSTLFLHNNGAALFIDTPGVKEWGTMHLTPLEVLASFPEIRPALGQCKFRNCDHSPGVEGCAVQAFLQFSLKFYKEFKEDDEGEGEGEGEEEIEEIVESMIGEGEIEQEELPVMMPERLKSLEAILHSFKNPDRIRTGDYIKPTGRMRNLDKD